MDSKVQSLIAEIEARASAHTRRDELRADLQRLEGELARHAEAIADHGPLESVMKAIAVREQRRDALRTELRAMPATGRPDVVDPNGPLRGRVGAGTALALLDRTHHRRAPRRWIYRACFEEDRPDAPITGR